MDIDDRNDLSSRNKDLSKRLKLLKMDNSDG